MTPMASHWKHVSVRLWKAQEGIRTAGTGTQQISISLGLPPAVRELSTGVKAFHWASVPLSDHFESGTEAQ